MARSNPLDDPLLEVLAQQIARALICDISQPTAPTIFNPMSEDHDDSRDLQPVLNG